VLRAVRALCVVMAFAASAAAQTRIVVMETPDVDLPALGTRIVMHGARGVEVITVREASVVGLPARAPEILTANDATLLVWVDAADADRRTLVVFVAGTWPDRALIELVRVDAATPPAEIERLVSLKVVGLLDSVLAPKQAATALGVAEADTPDRWRLALGFDTALGTADRAFAVGPLIAIERRWSGRVPFGLHAGGRMLLASTVDNMMAATSIDEYMLHAGASITFDRALFASASVIGTLLRAHAAVDDGRRGSVSELVPVVQVGVGARLALSTVELSIGLFFEHSGIRQRFLVDGSPVADLGRERGIARIALSVPLR
jgi:hypothetical protein